MLPRQRPQEVAEQVDEPEDYEEFDVHVVFKGRDFELSVLWTTDASAEDETRVIAAAEWFERTYGFDPSQAAEEFSVLRVGR